MPHYPDHHATPGTWVSLVPRLPSRYEDRGRPKRKIACALVLLATLAAPGASRASAAGQGHISCIGTDVTAAINTALATGGAVLSAGTCLVSNSLLPPSGVALVGAGAGVTTIRETAAGVPVIQIGIQANKPVTGVSISGLTINGEGVSGDGVLVRSGSRASISAIEVTGAGESGVRFGGSGTVSDSYIHDNAHNGIFVQGVAQPGHPVFPAGPVQIIGNLVRHNSLARAPGSKATTGLPAWDGIDCDDWHTGCTIESNTVMYNDILLHDTSVNGWHSGQDHVSGNTVSDSAQSGIDVAGNIDNFTVSGNTLINDMANSIVIGGPVSGGVVGNNAIQGGGPAIVRTNASNGTVQN